jgi:hypothetical protein
LSIAKNRITRLTLTAVPGAGHGLNLEYSHPTTYASVLNYFVQNGLGPDGSGKGKGRVGNITARLREAALIVDDKLMSNLYTRIVKPRLLYNGSSG